MGLPNQTPLIGVTEYLEGEKSSPVRHEYMDGQIFAMSGSSRRHNRIAGNFYRYLSDRLDQRECEVFIESIKVPVGPTIYCYPDVVVTCEPARENDHLCEDPILIVEIISPTTEQIDRREKAKLYKQIDSLQEYVLVEQVRIAVEVHRRNAAGNWDVTHYADGDDLELVSLGLIIGVSEFYAGVQFD